MTLRLSGERALRPLAVAHEAVGLRNAPRDGEQQADREVGHVVVQHLRRVGDRHAALVRRCDVDAVVADAEHRDHFERRQAGHQLARHLGLAVRDDRADARGGGREGIGVVEVRPVVHRVLAMQRIQQEGHQGRDDQHLGPLGGVGFAHAFDVSCNGFEVGSPLDNTALQCCRLKSYDD